MGDQKSRHKQIVPYCCYSLVQIQLYVTARHLSLLASGSGNIDVLKRLLEYKVDVNTVYDGYTPLITASRNGHTDIVRLLLVHNADPNIRCEAFNTFPKVYLTALDVAENSDIKVLIRNQIRWYRRKAFVIMLAENGYIQSSPYVSNQYTTIEIQ